MILLNLDFIKDELTENALLYLGVSPHTHQAKHEKKRNLTRFDMVASYCMKNKHAK